MNSPLEPSNYYHFYNRGNNKENIFLSDDNYIFFIKLMEKYLVPIADIYSYCLLPNHFHFVLRIKDHEELPEKINEGKTKIHQPFSNLFNSYAKSFNKWHNRSGSLFQKHPKRKLISDQEYFKNLIIYVNTNPLHHLISDFSTYKYSSYIDLISNCKTYLKKETVIDLFNDVNNFKYMVNLKKMNVEIIDEFNFKK
jgi:REP element-mobilizing transposase RayT